jgi:DNA-binding CsgD family transcriptional regulator
VRYPIDGRSPPEEPVAAGNNMPVAVKPTDAELLERELDLARINRVLARAGAGSGGAVLIWGPAGIGKSSLLAHARAMATAGGATVLRARGGELEREYGLGVVRQLLDPVLAAASPAQRSEWLDAAAGDAARLVGLAGALPPPTAVIADPSFGILHGLYWLCAQLASSGPVSVVVDDAQWADTASLRYLAYLLPRIEELRISMVIAVRSGEGDGASDLLATLAADPLCELVEPSPLSQAGVSWLLARTVPQPLDPAFAARCHEATGGIPFLVEHLARRFAAEGITATAAAARQIEAFGGDTVARWVRLRLARLGRPAFRLARAMAILESGEPAEAAKLAGIVPSEAAAARDALVAAGVLTSGRPAAFVHPIVRRAVYDDIGEAERAARHRQAAQLLARAGSPGERVAQHLLATEPAADAWVVDRLFEAAGRAARVGASESAATYLRRALVEPPAPGRRSAVLLELGRAEFNARQPDALAHLKDAVRAASDVRERTAATLILALCLSNSPPDGAIDSLRLLDETIASLSADDEPLAILLDTWAADIATLAPDLAVREQARIRAVRRRANLIEAPSREVLALAADIAVRSNEPACIGADLARRSLRADPDPLVTAVGAPSITVLPAVAALLFSEHYDELGPLVDKAIADAGTTGDRAFLAGALCFRARAALNHGDLAAAEADARTALRVGEATWFRVLGVAFAIEVLVERGSLEEAENDLAAVADEVDGTISTVTFLRLSRGRLRLAQLRADEALADFLSAGEVAMRLGLDSPSWIPWRSCAALACLALGEGDRARELAAGELELARAFGAPRALGVALHAAGMADVGDDGDGLLREAVESLGAAGAVLDRAGALCDLGARLRRANHRADSRELLREALDTAHRAGAAPLAARAETELRAAGARPRRAVLTGADAMTASERRIAELAASGLTNRQIAQALFITARTVEGHLTSIFRKLAIDSREHLSTAL